MQTNKRRISHEIVTYRQFENYRKGADALVKSCYCTEPKTADERTFDVFSILFVVRPFVRSLWFRTMLPPKIDEHRHDISQYSQRDQVNLSHVSTGKATSNLVKKSTKKRTPLLGLVNTQRIAEYLQL